MKNLTDGSTGKPGTDRIDGIGFLSSGSTSLIFLSTVLSDGQQHFLTADTRGSEVRSAADTQASGFSALEVQHEALLFVDGHAAGR